MPGVQRLPGQSQDPPDVGAAGLERDDYAHRLCGRRLVPGDLQRHQRDRVRRLRRRRELLHGAMRLQQRSHAVSNRHPALLRRRKLPHAPHADRLRHLQLQSGWNRLPRGVCRRHRLQHGKCTAPPAALAGRRSRPAARAAPPTRTSASAAIARSAPAPTSARTRRCAATPRAPGPARAATSSRRRASAPLSLAARTPRTGRAVESPAAGGTCNGASAGCNYS